jgi:nucleoside-diphosphate-sugar epimerase
MKNILITGNNGFVGTYVEQTLNQKFNTIGVSRSAGYDISDYSSLDKIKSDTDVIVHIAAMIDDDYESLFQANVIGTLNLCKYAKVHGVKHFVLISSLSVFDQPTNEYFNNYAKTKKASEDVAIAYCTENNIDLTILRLSQVYDDARLGQNTQAMLYYFIDTIQTKGKIRLFGRTNPLRNYVHIEYVCDVIKEVIDEKKVGTWNIIEEKNHTITEIAYMIFDIFQKQPGIEYLTDKPNIPSVHIPNEEQYYSEKISNISLKKGLQRIINYDK